MALGSALKKITTEAKKIRKAHPGKSWKSAVKEAGSKYRQGKLKRKKPRKVGAVKKKAKRRSPRKRSARRRSSSKPIVRTRTLTVVKYRTRTVKAKRRSVSGAKKSKTLLYVILAALGIGAVYVMTKKSAPAAALVPRANPATSSTAATIVAIAQAAGIVGNQLQAIVTKLNSSSDDTVQQAYANITAGGGIINPDNPTAFIAGY